MLSDRKLQVQRPRLREKNPGKGKEVEVPAYTAMHNQPRLSARMWDIVMRGVSTRQYKGVIPEMADTIGVSKSSVSRRTIEASEAEVEALLSRRFDEVKLVILYIDGMVFGDHVMIGAVGVDTEGNKHVLGLREGSTESARVVQLETGGGFGGKEEYPTLVALHALLLARKSGRPVKLIYGQQEDVEASTKRHPSRVEIATGCDRDGTLRAVSIRVLFDGGAYVTLTPVVLSRGALHACGAYRWEDVTVEALAVATNTPPNGAFRGFGAPQTVWAIERHLDPGARTLGVDPLELKKKNLLRLGDTTARDLGRLTLNPIPHIDPVGSVLVPLFSLVAGAAWIIGDNMGLRLTRAK